MSRPAAFFLSFIFSVSVVLAQPNNLQKLLEWNEYYILSWDDFAGEAPIGVFGDAATTVHIKAKPYFIGNEIKYNVNAYFNREKSWTRDKSTMLLSHERIHFHIAELFARKIRKKINAMALDGVNDLATYNAAINVLLVESNAMDELYDKETLHGALLKRQEYWNNKILSELAALKEFRKKKSVLGKLKNNRNRNS